MSSVVGHHWSLVPVPWSLENGRGRKMHTNPIYAMIMTKPLSLIVYTTENAILDTHHV
jgi:hypothetical protein